MIVIGLYTIGFNSPCVSCTWQGLYICIVSFLNHFHICSVKITLVVFVPAEWMAVRYIDWGFTSSIHLIDFPVRRNVDFIFPFVDD